MSEPVVLPSAVRAIRPTDQLLEALNEIEKVQELEEDWDLDGARRIDPEAIRLASRLVRSVEELAWQEGVRWQMPEIGPVPDGSVALTWEGSGRQTLMVFRPGEATAVECVTREEGNPPVRQFVSEAEAGRLALWALSDQ
jgi:hypothetical protein